MTASLYGDLKAAGVPLDNHESDLYFPCTEQSRAILTRFPHSEKIATKFKHQQTCECWLEVPFAFLPWWEQRATANAARAGEAAPARILDVLEPDDLKD